MGSFRALFKRVPFVPFSSLNLQNAHVGMDLKTSDDPFQLEVPRAASERCFSERAFSYIAPCLLNRLPASLKELDSIATFKSKLKTFIFERAFDLSYQSMNAIDCNVCFYELVHV